MRAFIFSIILFSTVVVIGQQQHEFKTHTVVPFRVPGGFLESADRLVVWHLDTETRKLVMSDNGKDYEFPYTLTNREVIDSLETIFLTLEIEKDLEFQITITKGNYVKIAMFTDSFMEGGEKNYRKVDYHINYPIESSWDVFGVK